jgi:hypothetical protein
MMGVGKRALAGVLAGSLLVASAAVQAALSEPVDGMVYDDVLDLCWLQDASASGELTWEEAVAWAENLEFGGHDDWRLARMSNTSPTTSITVCTSTNAEACRTGGNELGYNLYHNLGGPGTGNRGPFTNIPTFVWSGTAGTVGIVWTLSADNGIQFDFDLDEAGFDTSFHGWAVRPGQCRAAPGGAEPVPAVGAWGLGALGLLLMLLARARLR